MNNFDTKPSFPGMIWIPGLLTVVASLEEDKLSSYLISNCLSLTCRNQLPTAFFSKQSSVMQCLVQIIKSNVDFSRTRLSSRALKQMENWPLLIDNFRWTTLMKFKEMAPTLVDSMGTKVIIIDSMNVNSITTCHKNLTVFKDVIQGHKDVSFIVGAKLSSRNLPASISKREWLAEVWPSGLELSDQFVFLSKKKDAIRGNKIPYTIECLKGPEDTSCDVAFDKERCVFIGTE